MRRKKYQKSSIQLCLLIRYRYKALYQCYVLVLLTFSAALVQICLTFGLLEIVEFSNKSIKLFFQVPIKMFPSWATAWTRGCRAPRWPSTSGLLRTGAGSSSPLRICLQVWVDFLVLRRFSNQHFPKSHISRRLGCEFVLVVLRGTELG